MDIFNTSDVLILLGGGVVAFVVVCLLMPVFIPFLRKLKFGQQIIEEYGPTWHKNKQGVPTMGGLVFILAAVVTFLVFGFSYYRHDIITSKGIACLLTAVGFGLIGFIDDFIKIRKKHNEGLTEIQKLLLQILVSVVFIVFTALNRESDTNIYITLSSTEVITFDLGVFAYAFWFIIMIGFSNAVNLTDGLDGLATGVTVPVMIFFVFVGKMMCVTKDCKDLSLLSAIMIGACLGFLVFNWHPAKIFMGDTGSMFLGGIVTTVAISLDVSLLLLLSGIVFLIEAFSVIIQRTYFKLTHGKRLFKMTPIHHSFEMSGWKEEKIVLVFTAVSVIGCSVAAVIAYLLFRSNIILL